MLNLLYHDAVKVLTEHYGDTQNMGMLLGISMLFMCLFAMVQWFIDLIFFSQEIKSLISNQILMSFGKTIYTS